VSLTLQVDLDRWRRHLAQVRDTTVGLVPVIKGNGYGFGNTMLAGEAALLGLDTIAVGRPNEVADVIDAFEADVIVLEPWSARTAEQIPDTAAERVVYTVSHLDALGELAASGAQARVIVELMTDLRRHGVEEAALARLPKILESSAIELVGFSIHLPITSSPLSASAAVLDADRKLNSAGYAELPLYASHIEAAQTSDLPAAATHPLHIRVGTKLWLGDRGATSWSANVLDAHPVKKGDHVGYRQRRVGAGHVVVLGAGTADGIALAAPSNPRSMGARGRALANGGLDAAGRSLSPFTIGGRKRWFVEPPHMQTSMVWLPSSVTPPAIGDGVPVEVRATTARAGLIDLR
jgi:alanine racemase